jgi:hypothetical protein
MCLIEISTSKGCEFIQDIHDREMEARKGAVITFIFTE